MADPADKHSDQCEKCDGSGFVMLYDYHGPDDHDEDNCECIKALSGSDPNAELCATCRILAVSDGE